MANEFTPPQDQLASLKAQLSAEHAKVAALELDSLKTRIAAETGLPLSLSDRLQGKDETELRTDALSLSQMINRGKPAPPLRSNEPLIDGDMSKVSLRKMVRELTRMGYDF